MKKGMVLNEIMLAKYGKRYFGFKADVLNSFLGHTTIRPFIVGCGCDGSTDNNIHYVAEYMVKKLGFNYKKIYENAYSKKDGKDCAEWIDKPLSELEDSTGMGKVKDTTTIPDDATVGLVLEDLYQINNRSLVEVLEELLEKYNISLKTKLKDLKKVV